MSTEDDPFAAYQADRTIIKPSAGRASRTGPARTAAHAPATVGTPASSAPMATELPASAGMNPLLQVAAPLLLAGPALRAMPRHANPQLLRDSLVQSVQRFEADARARGLPNEQVIAARYVLCTFVDECAASTPWGSGMWASQSLLGNFHNEAWGGEKVFQLMAKLAENVAAQRNLLELLSVVLALGFEGRYRVLENGRAQLDSVRERLALMLRQSQPPVERDLSPRWQGIAPARARLVDGIPLWVIATLIASLLGLVFVALRFAIQDRTDPVFQALQSIRVKPSMAAVPPPPVASAPRLSGFLAPEIAAGQVAVRDLADRSIVTIAGDGFFEPGSAEVSARVRPLLGRIAEALNGVKGAVLVTGHTDSQPIRSLRFPSNFHLSQERAESVRQMLARTLAAERLKSEGRADTQPVDDNATTSGRARNRRVEITLTVARPE